MKKALLIAFMCFLPCIIWGENHSTYNTDVSGCWVFKDLEIIKINLESGQIVSAMLISSELTNDQDSNIDDFIISNLCVSDEGDRTFVLTTKSGKTFLGDLNDTLSTYVNIVALSIDSDRNYSQRFYLSRAENQMYLIKDFYSEDRKSKTTFKMVLLQ